MKKSMKLSLLLALSIVSIGLGVAVGSVGIEPADLLAVLGHKL